MCIPFNYFIPCLTLQPHSQTGHASCRGIGGPPDFPTFNCSAVTAGLHLVWLWMAVNGRPDMVLGVVGLGVVFPPRLASGPERRGFPTLFAFPQKSCTETSTVVEFPLSVIRRPGHHNILSLHARSWFTSLLFNLAQWHCSALRIQAVLACSNMPGVARNWTAFAFACCILVLVLTGTLALC